ncbi:DMT family transporter (plasmid) [Rhizobium lusitanum]|uniref:DMT family transporter n=1 Tax=Rhizobium lusitanum TaxID=293958 RepID=UPI00160900CF|nr:DMT family transporter [Rhizobium lusitanum]QND44265.1 DMT family transporter [Rhizobium lusitanum]
MNKWYFSYPIMAIIIWTGSPIAAKLSVNTVDPVHIAFLRWLIAFLILTPFVLPSFLAERRKIYPNLPRLAVLGLLGMVIYQSLAYFAAPFTTATNIGLLNATIPIFSIIVETAIFRRSPSLKAILGCVIAFCGVIVLVSRGNLSGLYGLHINFGDFLILLSCLSYATYSVLIGKTARDISPWHSLYAQIGFAVGFLLPGFMMSDALHLNLKGAYIILYVGIPASILAPYFWMQGVRHLGSSRTSAFLNVVPITTLLAAVVLLGEPLAAFQIIGGLLALAGVILSQL